MAINFLDGVSVNGELTTTGATNNITTTNGSSSLYLLNLTRTTTSLTTAGSVGVGTTSPTEKLHVKTSGVEIAKYETTATADLAIELANSQGSMFFGLGGGEQFGVGTTSDLNGTGSLFIIEQGGNVGIGTTVPSHPLSVVSSYPQIKIQQTGQTPYFTFGSGSGYAVFDGVGTSGGLLDIRDDGSSRMRIDASGNVGIGTTGPGAKLQVNGTNGTTQSIIGYGTQNLYVGVSGTNVDLKSSGSSSGSFTFSTGNTERLRITNGGNVGIGTTAPSQELDVSGNIVFSQRVIANSNQYYIKYGVWNSASNYGMGMTTGFSYGALNNNYAMTFCMSNTAGRGFWWGYDGQSKSTGWMSLAAGGLLKVDKSIAVGNINPSTTQGRIDASNDIVAYSTSDIRLKDNIKTIDKALDKVNSIQGVEFDWIEKEEVHGNSGHDIGVIAQEIEEILPDVVTTRDSGYKAVKYEKIVPLLIEAIKDLSKQVDELKRLI